MAAKKILLVEDDNNLREIYGARLQAEGFDIVSAPDGENALAVAVKEKPDLIISDIMMPKVSGFDMLDILRNAPETKDTKIIMMTALSQAEDKARADKLGADLYLVKSQVTLEDVTKAVHKILGEPTDASQEAESAAGQEMVSGDKPQEQPADNQGQGETSPDMPTKNPAPADQPAPSSPAPAAPVPVAPAPPPPVTAEPTPAPVENQPTETPASPPVETENPANNNPAPEPEAPANDTASAPVEPNLAQALEDEEKAVQEKIESFENSSDVQADTSSPAIADDQATSDDEAKEQKPPNPLDDKPVRKVIKPINDLSKQPDINKLVAQEEAKEAAGKQDNPSQTGQNPNPPAEPPANTDNSSDDDLGKISL